MAYLTQSSRRVEDDIWVPRRDDERRFYSEPISPLHSRHASFRYNEDSRRSNRDVDYERSRLPERELHYEHHRPSQSDHYTGPTERAPIYNGPAERAPIYNGPAERDPHYAPRRSSMPVPFSAVKYRDDDRYYPPADSDLPPTHDRSLQSVHGGSYPVSDREMFHDRRATSLPEDPYRPSRSSASSLSAFTPARDKEYLPQQSTYQEQPYLSPKRSAPLRYSEDEARSHRSDHIHYRQEQGRVANNSRLSYDADLKYSDHERDRNYEHDLIAERSRHREISRRDSFPMQISHLEVIPETPMYKNDRSTYARERIGGDLQEYRPRDGEREWSRRSDPSSRKYENDGVGALYVNHAKFPARRSSAPSTFSDHDNVRYTSREMPVFHSAPHGGKTPFVSSRSEKDVYRERPRSTHQDPFPSERENPYVPTRASPYRDKTRSTPYPPAPLENGPQYSKKNSETMGKYRSNPETSPPRPRASVEVPAQKYPAANQVVSVPRPVPPPVLKWQRHNVQFCDADFDFPAVTNPRGWAQSYELNFSRSYGRSLESEDGIGSWTGTGSRGLAKMGSQLDPQWGGQNSGSTQYAWLSNGATLFQQLVLEPGEYRVRVVLSRPVSETGSGSMVTLRTSIGNFGGRVALTSEQKVLSALVTSKQWVGFESGSVVLSGSKPCSVNFEFSSQNTTATIGKSEVRSLVKQVLLYSRGVQSMENGYM